MGTKKHFCTVSGKEIPSERVDALKMLGVPESKWTCVEHSTTKPKQGIFMGEHGTSDLKMVDKVYDDSVRSVFKSSDHEVNSEIENKVSSPDRTASSDGVGVEEPAKPGYYSEKEINYYTEGEDSQGEEKVNIVKKLDN
jgi:hypothetical protein